MNIILAEHAINNTVNNQNVKLKKKKMIKGQNKNNILQFIYTILFYAAIKFEKLIKLRIWFTIVSSSVIMK